MGEVTDRDQLNDKLNVNGNEQQKGLEAEDIVADAIKLNVDDDLNEQRYDHSSMKSSNFQNGNQNTLDNANLEDEPNYEEQEIDEEEQDDEQYLTLDNEEEIIQNETNSDDKYNNENGNVIEDDAVESNASNTKTNEASSVKKEGNEITSDKSSDGEKKKSDGSNENKNQDSKSNDTSKSDSKEANSNKDAKKDGNSNETDAKSAKSKSSSSTKDKEKSSSDHKSSSSNDKVLWVSGLASIVKASNLQTIFKKHGKVVAAKIIRNVKIPGSNKYFGVITMETVEQAEKCIEALNKTEFEGKTITVEKNKIYDEKKSNDVKDSSDKKDGDKSSKRDRSKSKSPKRRSFLPIRRFPLPHRPNFPIRRGPPFGGFRGGFGPRPPFHAPFMPRGPPIKKFELMRRREIRMDERRRNEDFRRQRDLERRQQEERDKLEREKIKLKLERERLEREKADFLRVEREKARLERERIEQEREELRRKQVQIPSARGLDDSRIRSNLTPTGKRYDDLYSSAWEHDRKPRFSNSGSGLITDLIDRRKLDVSLPATSRDYDLKRGSDRDDRTRQTSNSSQPLSYYKDATNRSSLSGRDRDSRDRRDDWKSGLDRRTDSRFLDKNPLTTPTQSSYHNLSSVARGSSYDRAPSSSDAWSSAPDRIPPASSLNKFPSFAVSAIADRTRPAQSLSQSIMSSSIGMYNQSTPMGGVVSNPNYNNSNLNSGYRRGY